MKQTIDFVIFNRLSEENQIKIEHIYCIAAILAENDSPPLTWDEFANLYDKSIKELEDTTGYIKRALNADAPIDLDVD